MVPPKNLKLKGHIIIIKMFYLFTQHSQLLNESDSHVLLNPNKVRLGHLQVDEGHLFRHLLLAEVVACGVMVEEVHVVQAGCCGVVAATKRRLQPKEKKKRR